MFPVEQVGERSVHHGPALVGERHEHAAPVPRIWLAPHQARLGEPVDPVGHGSRCDQGGAQQRSRGELEWRPGPAQRGEHIEPPELEAAAGERGAPRDIQVPGQPGDPAEHLQRLDVEVRPLSTPLRDEVVNLITRPAGRLARLGGLLLVR